MIVIRDKKVCSQIIKRNKLHQKVLVLSKSQKGKKKSKPWPLSKYEASGGCEETLIHHRDEAALYRGVGLNSSRLNSAEALSPAWWISSGSEAVQRHVFCGWAPGWPLISVMWMVCVKGLRLPLQRDRGRMSYFRVWGESALVGNWSVVANARMWWDCLSAH